MYKLAICSLLAGSAAAFAPSSQRGATSSALAAADLVKGPYENELGAQAPLGFFDPFGSKYNDVLHVLPVKGDERASRLLISVPVYFHKYIGSAVCRSALSSHVLSTFPTKQSLSQ